MSKQEVIVCAAVRFSYEGNNEGLVVKDIVMCLDYTAKMIGYHESDLQDHGIECHLERGFITNKNRFVDAEEALKITGWGNQLRFKDRKYLLPEDLY